MKVRDLNYINRYYNLSLFKKYYETEDKINYETEDKIIFLRAEKRKIYIYDMYDEKYGNFSVSNADNYHHIDLVNHYSPILQEYIKRLRIKKFLEELV